MSGEGVDYDYIGDIDPNLICSICFSVFNEPVTSSACKHTFCRSCIEQCITSPGRAKCPIDRSAISLDVLVDAGAAFRNILEDVKVQCKAPGCLAIFERSLATAHKASCGETVRPCPNEGCHKQMKRKEMIKHLTDECVGRKYLCSACGVPVTVQNYSEHQHLKQPGKSKIACSFCQESVWRHEVVAHRWSCTKAIISCPHARHGCPTTMQRSALGDHIALCPYEQLSGFLNETKRRIKDLERDLRDVGNTCRTGLDQMTQYRLEHDSMIRGLDEMVLPMWRLMGVPATNNENLRDVVETRTTIPLDDITEIASGGTAGPFGVPAQRHNNTFNTWEGRLTTERRTRHDGSGPRYHNVQGPQPGGRGRLPRFGGVGVGVELPRSRTETEIGGRSGLIDPPTNPIRRTAHAQLVPDRVVDIPASFVQRVPPTPVVVPLSPTSQTDSDEPLPTSDGDITSGTDSDEPISLRSDGITPESDLSGGITPETDLNAVDVLMTSPLSAAPPPSLEERVASQGGCPQPASSSDAAEVEVAHSTHAGALRPPPQPAIPSGARPPVSAPQSSRQLRSHMLRDHSMDDLEADEIEEAASVHSRRSRTSRPRNGGTDQQRTSLTVENLHVHESHSQGGPTDDQRRTANQVDQAAPGGRQQRGGNRYSRGRPTAAGQHDFSDLAFERLGYPSMPAFPSQPVEVDDQLSDLRGVVYRLAEGMDTMERQHEARNVTENLRLQEEVNSLRAIVQVMRNQVMLGHQGQFARPPPTTTTHTPSSPSASDRIAPDPAIRESIAFADPEGPSETSSISSLITANNPVQRPRGSMWGRGLGQPMGIPPELDDGAPTVRVQVSTRPMDRLEGTSRSTTSRSRTSVLDRLHLRNRASRTAL